MFIIVLAKFQAQGLAQLILNKRKSFLFNFIKYLGFNWVFIELELL